MFKGSIVAIVTPLLESGEIDYKAFEALIEFHIQNKTNAIVVNGTTGESATLTLKESNDLIKFAIKVANKRIPIIAGTGTNSTSATIKRTLLAKELGVDACLLVTPYYNRPTQEGLFLHYKEVAAKVNIPIILYNVPTRTSCDLLPETVAKLSLIKNIIGIKEATGDINRIKIIKEQILNQQSIAQNISQNTPHDIPQDINNINDINLENIVNNFKFYSGDDSTCLQFIKNGGHGVISVTANIAPKLMSDMYESFCNNDYENALKIDTLLQDLHTATMIEPNPIPIKWALNYLGFIKSGIRLPLTHLTKKNQQIMQAALNKATNTATNSKSTTLT